MKVHGQRRGFTYGMVGAAAPALMFVTLGLFGVAAAGAPAPSAAAKCTLTPSGGGDPFYKPNPPVRSSVGTGHVLTGVVRSGIDCAPIRGARVEIWLRGPDGRYDDVHRGTVVTGADGHYRFQSNFPGDGGMQPHIHLRIAVPGFRPLVTVYLPPTGSRAGALDLVLEPEV